MSLAILVAIGFLMGAFVTAMSLLTIVGRHKLENIRMKSLLEAASLKNLQIDKQRAIMTKRLIDSHTENQLLKRKIDNLRDQKLKAWGVPEKF
jgi:parvulin-like peptidyl-prolyl isomerase